MVVNVWLLESMSAPWWLTKSSGGCICEEENQLTVKSEKAGQGIGREKLSPGEMSSLEKGRVKRSDL